MSQPPGWGPQQGQPYASPAGPYAPPGYGPAGYGPSAPLEKNSKATYAFWLGIGAFLCTCAGPVALVLGLMAKKEIAAAPGRYSNAREATIGVVLGCVWVGLFVLGMIGVMIAPHKPISPNGAATTSDAVQAPPKR
jgi:hypothetical protein